MEDCDDLFTKPIAEAIIDKVVKEKRYFRYGLIPDRFTIQTNTEFNDVVFGKKYERVTYEDSGGKKSLVYTESCQVELTRDELATIREEKEKLPDFRDTPPYALTLYDENIIDAEKRFKLPFMVLNYIQQKTAIALNNHGVSAEEHPFLRRYFHPAHITLLTHPALPITQVQRSSCYMSICIEGTVEWLISKPSATEKLKEHILAMGKAFIKECECAYFKEKICLPYSTSTELFSCIKTQKKGDLLWIAGSSYYTAYSSSNAQILQITFLETTRDYSQTIISDLLGKNCSCFDEHEKLKNSLESAPEEYLIVPEQYNQEGLEHITNIQLQLERNDEPSVPNMEERNNEEDHSEEDEEVAKEPKYELYRRVNQSDITGYTPYITSGELTELLDILNDLKTKKKNTYKRLGISYPLQGFSKEKKQPRLIYQRGKHTKIRHKLMISQASFQKLSKSLKMRAIENLYISLRFAVEDAYPKNKTTYVHLSDFLSPDKSKITAEGRRVLKEAHAMSPKRVTFQEDKSSQNQKQPLNLGKRRQEYAR